MKAFKRMMIMGLCASVAVSSLAGCGSTEITLDESEEQIEITFSWWGSDSRHEYTIAAVKAFEEENPNIKVNLEYSEFTGFQLKTNVKMAAHTEADVMQINYAWVDAYSPDGTGFYDINQLADVVDLSNYSEESLGYGTVNGYLEALPIALNGKVFLYNETIYESYGLDIPQTWDDLFEAASVMSADGVYPLELEQSAMWFLSVAYVEQSTGKAIITDDNKFNFTQDDVSDMIAFYVSLVDSGVVMEVSQRSDSYLQNGTCAGTLQWVTSVEKYSGYMEEAGGTAAIGTVPLLSGASRSGWYVKPATMYAISANTEHPEESAKLLEFLVSSEDMALLQQLDKGVPSNQAAKAVLEENDLLTGIYYEASEMVDSTDTLLMSSKFEDSALSNAFYNACISVYYGESTLEDAAAEAYAEMLEDF